MTDSLSELDRLRLHLAIERAGRWKAQADLARTVEEASRADLERLQADLIASYEVGQGSIDIATGRITRPILKAVES